MNIILMAMTFVAFLLALGVRYSALSLAATLLGDATIARERRLTLNPARHMEPMGTCVALISAFPAILTGLPTSVGWGKPLRPDANRFGMGPNIGLIFYALTGILTNIILGVAIAFAIGFVPASDQTVNLFTACLGHGDIQGGPLQGCLSAWQPGVLLRAEQFVYVFALANITLGLLNIIPLFPLDGYYILFALLPSEVAVAYRNRQQLQEIILLALLFVLPFLMALSGANFSINQYLFDAAENIAGRFSGFLFPDALLRL